MKVRCVKNVCRCPHVSLKRNICEVYESFDCEENCDDGYEYYKPEKNCVNCGIEQFTHSSIGLTRETGMKYYLKMNDHNKTCVLKNKMTVTEKNLVGTVKIPANAQLQVTFTYTVGSLYGEWRSVLSIGTTKRERMPGVFIDKYNQIWFYWNMDADKKPDEKRIPAAILESGKRYSFHFYAQEDRMTLHIKDGDDDGENIFSRTEFGQQHNPGKTQPIYVGDDYHHPDGGVLENLIIREFKGDFNWWNNPIIWTYNDRTDASLPKVVPTPSITTCQCKNGIAEEICMNTFTSQKKCKSCNIGFHMGGMNGDRVCYHNRCTCENGVGHNYKSIHNGSEEICEVNKSEKCASCNDGFELVASVCKKIIG